MNCMRLVVQIFASFVLASTAPAMPREQNILTGSTEQALVCFYRGLDWDAHEEAYEIRIHDEKIGGLPGGSFLYHLAAPGRYIVFVAAEVNVSRSFQLLAGETYYIRVDRRGLGPLSWPKLLPVTLARGMREIRQLSYSGMELSPIGRHYCQQNGPRSRK